MREAVCDKRMNQNEVEKMKNRKGQKSPRKKIGIIFVMVLTTIAGTALGLKYFCPDRTPTSIENGDFETGDLSGWEYKAGTADGEISLEAVITGTTFFDEKVPYNKTGKYHFDGWKANSVESNGYVLKSTVFRLSGSGFISFKMGGNAACVKVYKSSGEQIAEYNNTEFRDMNHPNLDEGCRNGTMTTFVANLAEYLGERLYIELADKGADVTSWGVAFFDDIVTYYKVAPDVANSYDTVEFYKTTDGILSSEAQEYFIPWVLAVNSYQTES